MLSATDIIATSRKNPKLALPHASGFYEAALWQNIPQLSEQDLWG
jgi:hypothetical protein